MNHESPAETLTLERMRADIAKILNESPDEIGDNDSLIDIGLDSMRAMALLTAWSGNGIDYEFGDFAAAEPTLAGWWRVVETRQEADGAAS
ncbi:MAG: phosphopantetheine-binding protein [Pseudomonadota bacterium]